MGSACPRVLIICREGLEPKREAPNPGLLLPVPTERPWHSGALPVFPQQHGDGHRGWEITWELVGSVEKSFPQPPRRRLIHPSSSTLRASPRCASGEKSMARRDKAKCFTLPGAALNSLLAGPCSRAFCWGCVV